MVAVLRTDLKCSFSQCADGISLPVKANLLLSYPGSSFENLFFLTGQIRIFLLLYLQFIRMLSHKIFNNNYDCLIENKEIFRNRFCCSQRFSDDGAAEGRSAISRSS